MSELARVLVLDGPEGSAADLLRRPGQFDAVAAENLAHLLALVNEGPFAALVIAPDAPGLRDQFGRFAQAERILEALDIGIAILGEDGRIRWANATFRGRADGNAIGQDFFVALGTTDIVEGDPAPLETARAGGTTRFRLRTPQNSYYQTSLAPLPVSEGRRVYVAQCREVTLRVVQQQKLDALHKAGSSLAGLAPEQLDEMPVEERIKLLKQNLRKTIHDLLNYNVIEIRLLNRQTNRLEPVLAEGMTPEAENRVLYARADGNGVTGYVAATGKSYLCRDTLADSRYLRGAEGARSSMTVPLIVQDQVIGTFNVESQVPNAFGPAELQFAELFAREIAHALYMLELLTAQKYCAASESIKAVNREIALPVDNILSAATSVLVDHVGIPPSMAVHLLSIIEQARLIKQNILKVGDVLAPAQPVAAIDGLLPTRLKGKRVLVLDADEHMRKSAHAILEKLGCEVETAPTAKEALQLAHVSSYDAIISDVKPADMKGYEAYRQLRDAQPKARMILMAGFGYDGGHTLVKAKQDGLRFVLYKPFLVNQLVAALDGPEPPASRICTA
ncbi:MAG: response regulator [Gemmataceae bacterium]